MTRKPHKGYTEFHNTTVFVTHIKSRWTWDFKADKPLAFWSNSKAHYANYCYARQLMRRIAKRKLVGLRPRPVIDAAATWQGLSILTRV